MRYEPDSKDVIWVNLEKEEDPKNWSKALVFLFKLLLK